MINCETKLRQFHSNSNTKKVRKIKTLFSPKEDASIDQVIRRLCIVYFQILPIYLNVS